MKAIIVAAGRGRRLGSETEDVPKCMVAVGGRPILHRQLDALAAAGVEDIVIVRGYLGDRITPPPGRRVRFVENPAWEANNILASLMHASGDMDDGFVFSYSDIVFGASAARALSRAGEDVALVIDRRWRGAYEGRTLHPVPEAELARVESAAAGPARVTRVGKRAVPVDDAAGEFIGLARFSPAGAQALRETWQRALAAGLEAPFGMSATLRQAYLTDALNQMAAAGIHLAPVFIDGAWREIDTEQDLERAHALVDSWT